MRLAVAIALFSGLAACTVIKQGRGMVHAADGHFLSEMTFNFQSNFASSGKAFGAMPDGEKFEGTYSQGVSSTTFNGFAAGDSLTPVFGSSTTTSNNLIAVIYSDRGASARCVGQGTAAGGVAFCTVSDGRKIDVTW